MLKTGNYMNFRRQRGMTTLGMVILLVFIGLFVFAGIRLVPVYLEHMKIESVMNGVQQEFDGNNPSQRNIMNYIEKRFDVESVNVITVRDVQIRRNGEAYDVTVTYSNKTPFISNVSFAVDFDKKVTVRR